MKMTTTASFLYLLALLLQTGLTEGPCEVDNCLTDSCEGTNCTLCEDGYYKGASSNAVCYSCFIYCRNCGDGQCYGCSHASCHGCEHKNCYDGCNTYNVNCASCPDGYYKGSGGRCYRCFYPNCKCSAKYTCQRCLPGSYGTFCRNDCPDECVACKSSIECTECVPGKYGGLCRLNCTTTCQDGTCNKNSGNCFQRCTDNQYLDPDGTCKTCHKRCSTCIEYRDCTTCEKSNQWGSFCQYDCLSCSGQCDKNKGCLSGCNAKYYRHFNTTKQGYDCTRCLETCATCTSPDDCIHCEVGYWGAYCQHSCTDCTSECKKDNGCHSGCNSKYFRRYNTTKQGYECLKCPDTCATCNSSVNCNSCENGYWGTYCQHNCTNCFSDCNKIRGCGENCKTGYYAHAIYNGSICKECLENCKNCTNKNTCKECKDGYFVSDDKKCKTCPVTCKNSLCNARDGACLEACSPGNTGYRCNETCPSNCLECDQFDKSSCTVCKSGYHGNDCSSRCFNCQQSVCFQQNGTCMHGCIENFTGSRCNEIIDSEASPQSNKKDNNDDLAIPVGAGAGAVIVITILIIIAVIFLRRGRSLRKNEPKEDSVSLGHANTTFNKGENTYATITDPDTKEVSNISTEADIIKKESAILISETPANPAVFDKKSEKDEAKFDLKTDILSNSSPDCKTKSAITLKETTDSRELSVVEEHQKKRDVRLRDHSDVQESNDDIHKEENTYYNTVGKRVPVYGLAEYIRNKDYNSTVEEFHKLPRGLLKDYSVAKNPRNALRNRYKMIYPYDESRVILKDGGNDYVNASFIEGHNRTKEYIGSSGPFKRENSTNKTIPDFWRMVWQEKCETIVMLTKCYENAVKYLLCIVFDMLKP